MPQCCERPGEIGIDPYLGILKEFCRGPLDFQVGGGNGQDHVLWVAGLQARATESARHIKRGRPLYMFQANALVRCLAPIVLPLFPCGHGMMMGRTPPRRGLAQVGRGLVVDPERDAERDCVMQEARPRDLALCAHQRPLAQAAQRVVLRAPPREVRPQHAESPERPQGRGGLALVSGRSGRPGGVGAESSGEGWPPACCLVGVMVGAGWGEETVLQEGEGGLVGAAGRPAAGWGRRSISGPGVGLRLGMRVGMGTEMGTRTGFPHCVPENILWGLGVVDGEPVVIGAEPRAENAGEAHESVDGVDGAGAGALGLGHEGDGGTEEVPEGEGRVGAGIGTGVAGAELEIAADVGEGEEAEEGEVEAAIEGVGPGVADGEGEVIEVEGGDGGSGVAGPTGDDGAAGVGYLLGDPLEERGK